MYPIIKKASRIKGRTIELRDATLDDAPFIHGLRMDEELSLYLSVVSPELDEQVRWLSDYQRSTGQAYFVVRDMRANIDMGTVRLYNAKDDSFSWGSWIVLKSAPPHVAIESALMVYRYGIDLGFRRAHFEVRKANVSVWRFHERFGAKRVAEDSEQFFYQLEESAMLDSLSRYRRYLPDSVLVE